AGIDAAVGVSANLLIDRTDVQARAAADAVENLRLAAAEHLRSAVVDEHYVQFVRTVGLTDPPRTGQHIGIDGQVLACRAPREHLQHHAQRRDVGDDALDAHHGDVDT